MWKEKGRGLVLGFYLGATVTVFGIPFTTLGFYVIIVPVIIFVAFAYD